MVKIDLRKSYARASSNYITHTADIFAVAAKGSNETHFLLVKAEDFQATLKDKSLRDAFKKGEDGLRWKGLQANKCKVQNLIKRLVIRRKWNEFEVGSNGTMSDAQEQAVCNALNAIAFMGQKWTVTAHASSESYQPDITGDMGTTIEVKGFNGRIFHS